MLVDGVSITLCFVCALCSFRLAVAARPSVPLLAFRPLPVVALGCSWLSLEVAN